jgi:hypothetical protein
MKINIVHNDNRIFEIQRLCSRLKNEKSVLKKIKILFEFKLKINIYKYNKNNY